MFALMRIFFLLTTFTESPFKGVWPNSVLSCSLDSVPRCCVSHRTTNAGSGWRVLIRCPASPEHSAKEFCVLWRSERFNPCRNVFLVSLTISVNTKLFCQQTDTYHCPAAKGWNRTAGEGKITWWKSSVKQSKQRSASARRFSPQLSPFWLS